MSAIAPLPASSSGGAAAPCPVCAATAMPHDATACPVCRADLRPLANLARLNDALTALEASEARPRAAWSRPPRWIALAALVFVAGAFTGVAIRSRGTPAAPSSDATPPATTLTSGSSPARSTATPSLDTIATALASLSDFVVERAGERVSISGRDPLFRVGSVRLTPATRGMIDRIAGAIASTDQPLRIHVRGYADDTPVRRRGRWSSNWTVAFVRAQAVAERMRAATPHRRIAIEISSAGLTPLPSFVGAGSRCTVVIDVFPGQP